MDDKSTIESGRNDKGQFVSKQVIQQAASRALGKQAADIARARAQVDALTGAWKKQEVHIKRLANIQQKAFSTQIKDIGKLQKVFAKSQKDQLKMVQKAMGAQVKEYRRLANERVKAMRGSGGGGRGVLGVFGGSKGGGLGLGIGGFGLGSVISVAAAYGAYRKFMSMSAPFLSAELNQRGSAAAIRNAMANVHNVPMSKGAELIGRYQGLGKAQLFGSLGATKGLIRLQSELSKGMGADAATDQVENLTKSFGDSTDRLNAFLDAAGKDGANIKAVLSSFATGQNIVEVTRSLNALSIAYDASKQKLDPAVEANLKLQTTMDKLNATLENFVNNLLPRMLPYLEKGADLIDKWATKLSKVDLGTLAMIGGGYLGARALVGGGLISGGAKLAGRGLLAGGAAIGANPVGAMLGAGAIGALAIDKLRDKQGLGAMGWYVEKLKAESQLSDLAESRAEQFRQKRDSTTDPRKKLIYAKSEIAAYISKEVDPEKLKTLQGQWQDLTNQIRALGTAAKQSQPQHKGLWDTIVDGAKRAAKAMTQPTDKVGALVEQAKRQQQAGLNVQVAGSGTELARARLDLARTNFFGAQMGMMASVPEFKALQQTINNEIDKLSEQLKTVDASTEQGAIESNKIKEQILGLRKESKQGVIDLLQGLNPLDAIAAQALGSGKYERFLTTKERNLGKGLRAGEVRNNPLVGSINRNGALASPFRYSTNMGTSVSDLNRYSNQLQGLIPPQIRMLMPQTQIQQDLAGGMMMRPEAGGGGGPDVQTVQSSGKKIEQLKEILGGIQQLIRIEESDLQGGTHSGRVSSQTSF